MRRDPQFARLSSYRRRIAAVLLLAAIWRPAASAGNERSRAMVARAFEQAYQLDHDDAIATFKEAIAADPSDPAPYRGIAAITWLNILVFDRGSASLDDYLGNIARPKVKPKPAPVAQAQLFRDNVARAMALAEERLAKNPRDVDAQYQLGATVGVLTSYQAVIEGRVMGAFRAARQAYNAHEEVLALDPRRADAGLIVGSYRYVVAALALPVRMMAYVAGFGGGRERGIKLIEDAAAFPGDSQVDARFLLVLIYNRERNFDGAIRVLHDLQKQFPRNRLLWLNEGVTEMRAGRTARAEQAFTEGITRLESDRRPRAFGEVALWHQKRGAARVLLRRVEAARADLEAALQAPSSRGWVQGRTRLEFGKLADLGGDRRTARSHYQQATALCRSDGDGPCVTEAERLTVNAYK
jgi:tetratricopeptide (TPR) repeat protein